MKEKFIAFLKKHGAYEKFIEGILDGYMNFIKYFNRESKNYGVYLIGSTFRLSEPSEEGRYWKELDDLWQKELEKM